MSSICSGLSSLRFEPRLLRIFWQKLLASISCSLPLRAAGLRLLTTVWGTLLGVSAQLLPETMESHGLLLNLPLWTSNVLAGGCVGLLVGTATVTRHLVMKVAPVDGELQSLLPPADATDELAQLVRQALETYQQAASSLEEHPSARRSFRTCPKGQVAR